VLVGEGLRSIVILVVVVVLESRLVVLEHTVCLDVQSSLPILTTSPLFKILSESASFSLIKVFGYRWQVRRGVNLHFYERRMQK
jgi:hypothetical protein